MTVAAKIFRARHSMGRTVRGSALVAQDGFSARYDLDRLAGIFSGLLTNWRATPTSAKY